MIKRAIASCLWQTYSDFEIIVIDDVRSTDDMERTVSSIRDPRIRLHKGLRPSAAASRNKGIELAAGKYVAFLDSDDAFLPEKLENCLDILKMRGTDVVYSQVYMDRGVNRYWVRPRMRLEDFEDMADYLFRARGWIASSTVVLNTHLARRNPYREDLLFGDDQQFAISLWRSGARFHMIERPLIYVNDVPSPKRLSQAPLYWNAADHRAAYVDWLESERPYISAHAYEACYALFVSRLIVGEAPLEAARYIWTAFRNGGIGGWQALTQCVQTFAPRTYRSLSDLIVRLYGVDPPAAIRELGSLGKEEVG